MKVFKHLFTLVIFVSLIACTSDDDALTIPVKQHKFKCWNL